MILDGRSLAERIETGLRSRARSLAEQGRAPGLGIVSPAGAAYAGFARLKRAAGERVGVAVRETVLPPGATTADALGAIDAFNADAAIHGILIQHPLPEPLDERACFDRIAVEKDIDVTGVVALGRFAAGVSDSAPATVAGAMRLLEHHGFAVAGRSAVVAGAGPLFALPMAMALLRAGARVCMPGTEPAAVRAALERAEIIASGIGRPHAIPADWLPAGAVVLDAGYFNPEGRGDIDIEPARERLAAYAPVPGGLGPLTVAMLLEATVRAAEDRPRDR